jgi:cardiolipin synthase (CMP-forming)
MSVFSDLVTALNLPNILSLLRLAMVPFFIVALSRGDFMTGLILYAVAGATDALDGMIARWWKLQTPLGRFLDPMADKFLMTASFIVLSLHLPNQAVVFPLWLAILIISRDVIIVVVSLSLHLVYGIRNFPPSWPGKFNTIFQVATIFLVLLANVYPSISGILAYFYGGTLLFTALSGIHYMYRTARWLEKNHQPKA